MRFTAFNLSAMLPDTVSRRPLVAVAAGVLLGLACGYEPPDLSPWLLAASMLVWLVAEFRKTTLRLVVRLCFCGMLAGFASADIDLRLRASEFNRLHSVQKNETFVCRIGNPVKVRRTRGLGVRYLFNAETLSAESGAAVKRSQVSVQWFDSHPAYGGHRPKPGEVWSVKGTVHRAEDRHGLPAIRLNTRWEGAKRLQTAVEATTWKNRADRLRADAVRRVTAGIEDWGSIPNLIQAMLLGERNEIPPAMRKVFANSGTIHVFAISGLHIGMMALILVSAVTVFGVQRRYQFFFVAPVLILYTAVTGARPSAVRACAMALMFLSAPLFCRRPDGISVLSATVIAVYLWHPSLLFDAGCRLSFVVMGGLLLFTSPIYGWLVRVLRLGWLDRHINLLKAANAPKSVRRVWRRVRAVAYFVVGTFSVSLSAWLASIPLTAAYFGRFAPCGLLANLAIAPCSVGVVCNGCLGMAFAKIKSIATVFNHAAGFFTWIMIKASALAAAIPGGTMRVARWDDWMVSAWYAGLVYFGFWLRAHSPQSEEWLEL